MSIEQVAALDPSIFEAYRWRLKRTPFWGWRGVQVLIATYIGAKCKDPQPWWKVWPFAKEDYFQDFMRAEKERWERLPRMIRAAPRHVQDRYLRGRYGQQA